MPNTVPLAARVRDGSKKAKALRREGIVPGVVYGHRFDPLSVQFEYPDVDAAVREAGMNQLISLGLDDREEDETVLLRAVQRDPVTSKILHIDLYHIVAGEVLQSTVPLALVGDSPALDIGGVVNPTLTELEIECLPKDLPEAIEVDLSRLEEINDYLLVADLDVPDEVRVLTPADAEVVRIVIPRGIMEEAAAEELLEGEEIEEAEGTEGEEETASEDFS